MLLQCSWVTCEMGEWLYPLQKEGCCWTRASRSSGSSRRRVARRSENKQAGARQQISCARGADWLPSHTTTGARSGANSCSRSRQSPNLDGIPTGQGLLVPSPTGLETKAFKSLRLDFSNGQVRNRVTEALPGPAEGCAEAEWYPTGRPRGRNSSPSAKDDREVWKVWGGEWRAGGRVRAQGPGRG